MTLFAGIMKVRAALKVLFSGYRLPLFFLAAGVTRVLGYLTLSVWAMVYSSEEVQCSITNRLVTSGGFLSLTSEMNMIL